VIFRFVYIDGIGDHHYLNFLFITYIFDFVNKPVQYNVNFL